MPVLTSWRFWIGVVVGALLVSVLTLVWLADDSLKTTVLVRNHSSTSLEPVSIMLDDKTLASFDVPKGGTMQTSFKTGDASLSVAVRRGGAVMQHALGYVSNGMSSQYEITVTDRDSLQASEHPKLVRYLMEMINTPQAKLYPGR